MALTTKDLRINGYPSLDIIMAHFEALPLLVEAVRRTDPEVLALWDTARGMLRPPRTLVPVTRAGERCFDLMEEAKLRSAD